MSVPLPARPRILMERGLTKEQAVLIWVAAAYILTGVLGLRLAAGHPAVSVVWAPAGIMLGALVVLGYRLWPLFLIGGLIIYATALRSLPAVLALSAVSTLEGLLAAYLVNRFAGGRNAFQNPQNALRFAGLITLAALTVTAPLGAAALGGLRLMPWTDFGETWLSWCIGNLTGTLLVAPTLMMWGTGTRTRWRPRRTIEAATVFAAVVFVGLVVFCGIPLSLPGYPLEFLTIPVLLLAAFRLGRREAAAAILVLTILAVVGTLLGRGPFLRDTLGASLIMLQLFMSTTAVMTLSLAALASDYAVAEAQLRELVVTDPLTGLPNYRRLVEVLGAEIARSDRTGRPLAVVFFDMDGLKKINDELGHLVGSRAVCRVAETLRGSCRATDTPARFGGDEFVVVLPDTDENGAYHVVRRVSDRLSADDDKPVLAVSAGLAVYPRDGGTPATLLSAADRALYKIKAQKADDRRRGVVAIREWSSGVR